MSGRKTLRPLAELELIAGNSPAELTPYELGWLVGRAHVAAALEAAAVRLRVSRDELAAAAAWGQLHAAAAAIVRKSERAELERLAGGAELERCLAELERCLAELQALKGRSL